jgi:alkylation response protein AidB-like acyl-CoA dehydrogenase
LSVQLHFSEEDEAFRAELLGWLEEHPPPFAAEAADPPTSSADQRPWAREWQRMLFDAGYLVPGWPPEHGGRDANAVQQMIYFEEMTGRKIRRTTNPQGLAIIAPTILDHGTPEHIERFALPTLRAEISWCLGMSEPNAGSDLAALTTRAVRDGDSYIVNGQKVWTSGAQHSDWCLCFVRTDPTAAKHKGISVLIIDMRSPGIEHRPIAELTDHDYADFNEVFFTDVVVPVANLVGEENDGWRLSMGSLAHERAMLWINYSFNLQTALASLVAIGKERGAGERFRDAVASSAIDAVALQALGYRGFAKFVKGQASPEHSILKLFGSESVQKAVHLGADALGPDLSDLDLDGPHVWRQGGFATQYLRSFSATIPGGTSEIQRNIIAERVLGLPR